jgi:hypothetical protein
MSMRRFTRPTNAFSKKFENHCHALALYFVFYNFCRVHKTLGATPAMAAGVVDKVLKMTDVVGLIDARETPAIRWPYKKLFVGLTRKRLPKFQLRHYRPGGEELPLSPCIGLGTTLAFAVDRL